MVRIVRTYLLVLLLLPLHLFFPFHACFFFVPTFRIPSLNAWVVMYILSPLWGLCRHGFVDRAKAERSEQY